MPKPFDVEVSLRVPTFTVRAPNQEPKRVDNSMLRFNKRVEVTAVPKPGDTLQLTTRLGAPFDATVAQVHWHEQREVFVVACTYAKRSITAEEYDALTTDPDWSVTQLPA